MKIYVNHKTYKKINGRWVIKEDYGTKEINYKEYVILKNEKWKGDRRTYQYNSELGRDVMVRLSSTEPMYRKIKSVREFTFKK